MRFAIYFLFMVSINVMLFLGQTTVDNLKADGYTAGNTSTVYDYQNSLISDYDAGNKTIKGSSDSDLPTSIEGSNGVFSDLFNTFRSWAVDTFSFVPRFVNAVPTLLKGMGLPSELAFVLGFVWNITAIILLIGWLRWNM